MAFPGTRFPSEAHRGALARRLRDADWRTDKAFSERERLEWHAYTFGIRRELVDDHGRTSPIDPAGEWFDVDLVDKAEQALFPRRERSQRIPPAEMVADPELAEHFRRQDKERHRLRSYIEGAGLPDGDPTPEAIAFVECCGRQIRGNVARFFASTRRIEAPSPRSGAAESCAPGMIASTPDRHFFEIATPTRARGQPEKVG